MAFFWDKFGVSGGVFLGSTAPGAARGHGTGGGPSTRALGSGQSAKMA